MLTQRFVGGVLIMCLLSACAAIERGRSAPTSTDVRLEATSHSAPGSTNDHRTLQRDSIENALDEIDSGPKTERVVGMVAVATFALVLTGFIIVVYRVVQLLSN